MAAFDSDDEYPVPDFSQKQAAITLRAFLIAMSPLLLLTAWMVLR